VKRIILVCFLLSGHLVQAQMTKKSFEATRINSEIKIDGVIDELAWEGVPILTGFTQRRPNPGKPASRKTEVKLVYDDEAVYIAAKLYEKKDDVFNFLSNRDNVGNADFFGVSIDPFNAGLNGFGLFVTSAGVQLDYLYSNGGNEQFYRNDESWNAVWLSETKINDEYWVAEFKIPYAVLRFNSNDVQQWGINFGRRIRSLNEYSYWNALDPQIDGYLNQSGQVGNLRNIETPTRLFFYPYVSTVFTRSTETGFVSPQLNGGMDIKYGINDAFTLDATLIPDFSGVRSDNQVLNLSPFEVRFDEQRQFFTEGTELFNKAGLFYSRRIGSTFGNMTEDLGNTDKIIVRPQAAQLLNASKISGRTNGGLGIGFFNAITDRTFVTVQNTETGTVREVEADPLSNFNVLVLDQNLKNNSSITFTNNSVIRSKNGDDSNVTGLNFNINDESLTWRLRGFYGYSQIAQRNIEMTDRDLKTGYKYFVEFSKRRGNFQFELNRNLETDSYDINDLGFQRRANRLDHRLELSWIQFEPRGIFNSYRYRFQVEHRQIHTPRDFSEFQVSADVFGSFKNFWGFSINLDATPVPSNDFFEARVNGYVFERPEDFSIGTSLSTDRRRNLFISTRARLWQRPDWNQTDQSLNLSARMRVGSRFEVNHNIDYQSRRNERGYVTRLFDDQGALSNVVIGVRDVRNLTNTLSSSYIFTNRMGLTFRLRHYWSRVLYSNYFDLSEDDKLSPLDYTGIDPVSGDARHNRNFNQFNIDMEYNWQFRPGSEIRVIWKRSIGTDDLRTDLDFFQNFDNTISAPNFDTITVRMVYFIDYLNIRNVFRK